MKYEKVEQNIKAINELFITDRTRYILQNKDGSYSNSNSFSKNVKLTDSVVRKHLLFGHTVGIFCLDKFTKHITFDIDASDYSELDRQRVVLRLIDEIGKCSIPNTMIHTSISGGKGYHCTIHFNDLVYLNKAYDFYEYIISECGFSNTLVEFRPLPSIGQKLTLGIHKKTGIWCQYVDVQNNFSKIYDDDYLINIKTYDRDIFESIVDDIKLDENKIDKIRVIKNQLSPNKLKLLTTKEMSDIEKYGMINDGTRNYCSIQLAVYYNTLELSRQDAYSRLNNWIDAQDGSKFKTTLTKCHSENIKIVDWVYNNQITRREKFITPKTVTLFKREIDMIKTLDDIRYREVLLCMLIHSKIYNNSENKFSMSYEQISKNRGVTNDKFTSKVIKFLSENNFIEFTSNKKDRKSNVYSINFSFVGVRKVGKMLTISQGEYDMLYSSYFYLIS